MTWNPTQLPEQHGRNIFISGGDAGPGYFAAEQLAATGAHIIVASRQSPVAISKRRMLHAHPFSDRCGLPGSSGCRSASVPSRQHGPV